MKKVLLLVSVLVFTAQAAYSLDDKNGGTTNNSAISVSNFSLNKLGSQVKVSWFSTEGSDFESIVLEKAENIEDFKSLQSFSSYNSAKALRYISVDLKPAVGQNNYRLKIVNKDGSETYSEVISIGVRPEVEKEVAPAPVKRKVENNNYGLDSLNLFSSSQMINAA
ncbi:hypothetical protein [uncultured Arcticibacterium sp.]|uniref:hypothetical protein n=1 Tax=uncultured Arcticibacterium sp. TaxID=2173042 RepID=UPI0030F75816